MSDFPDITQVKRRKQIEEVIGRHVALKKAGAEYTGLCPFHAEKTASFTVVPRGAKTEDGFFKCHGCGAGGDVITFVIRYGLARDIRAAVAYLGGGDLIAAADEERAALRKAAQVRDQESTESAEVNRRKGYDVWRTGKPIDGTPVSAYLRETRKVTGDLPSPSVLRFVDGLWRSEDKAQRPGMIAAMQRPDGSFGALHRTWLGTGVDGGWVKLKPTRMWGPKSGCAIRLYPTRFDAVAFPEDAGATLYIAEGIETALSVLEGLRRRPDLIANAAVWAAGDLANLARVILPERNPFATVVMCMDADSDQAAALACEVHGHHHYGARGCQVLVAYPPAGTDFNDLLRDELAARPRAETTYNPMQPRSMIA